jgi:hypothetical protein
MAITRSPDLSQIYISQKGLTARIISDFLPKDFPTATYPDDKPYDRIKFVSIIMAIMYISRLSRPDLQLATAYLATKAKHHEEGDHKAALRIISYMSATINQYIMSRIKILVTL